MMVVVPSIAWSGSTHDHWDSEGYWCNVGQGVSYQDTHPPVLGSHQAENTSLLSLYEEIGFYREKN